MKDIDHIAATKEQCIIKFTEAIASLSELSVMFDDVDFENKEIKAVIGDLCTAREHVHRDLNS
jgi:hypothetical protein